MCGILQNPLTKEILELECFRLNNEYITFLYYQLKTFYDDYMTYRHLL